MAEPDDETRWIERSCLGDHEAFEALIRKYQHMIHSLAYRMTGSLSDAEDLSQETFLRAYQQISRFRGEARFSSWLYQIAVNACLNWRKATERQQQLHEDWAGQEQTTVAADRSLDEVRNALMKLNPKQRAAVILTTYDGLNHADASRALGCSETTVSWRLFVARRKLRRMLGKREKDL